MDEKEERISELVKIFGVEDENPQEEKKPEPYSDPKQIEKEWRELISGFSDREYNTIPKKVELKITFHEAIPELGSYNFQKNGKTIERAGGIVKATVQYNKKASHLTMSEEHPISIPKNAIKGLFNEIKATNKNFNIKNRTFKVFNKNNQTYEWTEVKEE